MTCIASRQRFSTISQAPNSSRKNTVQILNAESTSQSEACPAERMQNPQVYAISPVSPAESIRNVLTSPMNPS